MRCLAAAALALFALSPSALGEPTPEAPPHKVIEAIAAAQAPEGPDKVVVGAYVNAVQELDFKINSYAVDLYVWFRWKAQALDPSKTMEFMNRYDPNDHERAELYDKPKQMPDGSLYAIVRNQGRFSTKFQLADYPFDKQFLTVVMEDTISSENTQVYVPQRQPRSRDHSARLQGGQAHHAHQLHRLPNQFRRPRGAAGRHLFAGHLSIPGQSAADGDVGQDLRSHRV